MAGWIHPTFAERGYHIVSVNYRLCPQVTFAEQLEDLRDAWKWCHQHLEGLVGDGNIDLARSVIGGESAGGTFATLSGFILEPRPSVIINLYGPVLLSHPHFHVPADNLEEALASLQYSQPRTTEELEAALRDNDPARARSRFPWWPDLDVPPEKLRNFLGLPDYTVGEEERLRMDLYKYMSVRRNRFSSVFRRHTLSPEDFQKTLDSFSALELIKSASEFPPTFFVHGTADNAAPIGPSQAMFDQLKTKGVPVGARWVEGADHSFDVFITGPDQPGWEDLSACADFADSFVG